MYLAVSFQKEKSVFKKNQYLISGESLLTENTTLASIPFSTLSHTQAIYEAGMPNIKAMWAFNLF